MSTFSATDAFVNWGRWIAHCGLDECLGVENLTPEQELLGCRRCFTVSFITWPDNPDAIMSVLAARPALENRNWLPGETVTDLKRENAEHGLVSA